MATNRDYTGLQCTPSSLAWLIRRRAVAKGKLDRHLNEFERLPVTIAQDQAEIASLDMVISMHEVVVDPQVIKGLRKKSPHLAAYGAMSKAIWECLVGADRILTHRGCGQKLGLVKQRSPGFGDARQG